MVCDAHVASIMSGEDELVPETAQKEPRCPPPAHAQEHVGQPGEQGVATAFDEVGEVVTLVKTFVADPLVQFAVLPLDAFLAIQVERRIFGRVKDNLIPRPSIEKERLGFRLLGIRGGDRGIGGHGLAPTQIRRRIDRVKDRRWRSRCLLARALFFYRIDILGVRAELAALDRGEEINPRAFDATDLVRKHALTSFFRMQSESDITH